MPSLRLELSKRMGDGEVEKRVVQEKGSRGVNVQAESVQSSKLAMAKGTKEDEGKRRGRRRGGIGGANGSSAAPSSNAVSLSSSHSTMFRQSSSSRRRESGLIPTVAARSSSTHIRHSARAMSARYGGAASDLRDMASRNGCVFSDLRGVLPRKGVAASDLRDMATRNGVGATDLRDMAKRSGIASSDPRDMAARSGVAEDHCKWSSSFGSPTSKIGELLDLDTADDDSKCLASDLPAHSHSSYSQRQETQIRSIRELINQYLAPVPESQDDLDAVGAMNSPFKQCQRSGYGDADDRRPCCASCRSHPFIADIGVDTEILQSNQSRKKLSFPRTFSWHLNPSKSMEGPLFWETMHREAIASKMRSSAESPSPLKKTLSARGAMAEIHSSTSPICSRRWVSSNQCYSQKEKAKQSPQTSILSNPRDRSSRRLGGEEAKPCAVSPLSFGGYVEKADEFTPVSPLCRYNGEDHSNLLHWLPSSTSHLPLYSPKLDYQSRSKSLGAKASLRSAVRNLETTFSGGSARSTSTPKTRNDGSHGGDGRSEPSKLVQKLFTSPVKRRPKPMAADTIKDHAGQLDRDQLPSRRLGSAQHHSRIGCVGQVRPIISPSLGCQQPQKISEDAELTCNKSGSMKSYSSSWQLTTGDDQVAATRRFKDNTKTCQANVGVRCYLQCGVNDGMPFYTLFRNDSDEVLLARACEFQDYPSKQGCRGAYTFHSGKCTGKGTGGWKNWMRKENKTVTNLCGKMQVSTLLRPEGAPMGSLDQYVVVSEFVLLDMKAEYGAAGRSQSLRFVNMNRNSSRIFQSSFPSSDLRNPTSLGLKVAAMECSDHASVKRHHPSHSVDDTDLTLDIQAKCGNLSSPCQELAAIVVEVPAELLQQEFMAARSWNSHQSSHHSMFGRDVFGSQNVTVMLPREHHGLPDGRVCRPTSLIERWRCGGKCDCGGWDLGCGMKIFSSEKSGNPSDNALYPPTEAELLNIYSQGKVQELVLSLSFAQEDFFMLSFQEGLSSLEAFATAVAMLHSRKPLLLRRA